MKAKNKKQTSKKPNLKMKAGRNKKKTWKQLQHPDVDLFLDEMREDERLGGIRSKADQDLFAIDTSFDAAFESRKKAKPILYDSSLETASKEKEPLVNLDELKCFHLLKPHTLVPDPLTQRNRIRRPGEKKPAQMQQKDKQRQAKKASKQPEAEQPKPKAKATSLVDPWSTEDVKTLLDDNEWINESVRRHNLRPRIHPDKIKKHKTSELPAIDLPHPGYSYNPSFIDHQELLAKAASIETEKIRKKEKLIRAVAPTKCDSVDLDNVIKDESESEDEEDDKNAIHKLETPKARTRQKKRHEREEKEMQRVTQAKKLENARLNEVYRIKTLQKEITQEEKKQKARLAKVVKKKIAHEKFGQKELSKHKYKDLSLNPTLSDDLSGRLVATNVDNSLLVERFKSLQKRNILEPRVKTRTKRKLRLKKYQRLSAKMEWEKTGVWNGIKVL